MQSPAQIAALIVLTSFVSEDAAAVAAATLAASNALDTRVAFIAAAGGIWLGDLGLYALGRPLRSLAARWSFAERLLARAQSQSSPRFWNAALFASRFLPGTRLPLYTAAGLARISFVRFSAITAFAVVLWVSLLFAFAASVPINVLSLVSAALLALVILAALVISKKIATSPRVRLFLRKYRRWEFWPAWLFYPPVALMCLWHAIRFGGLSLPTLANPGQRNGGIVGESKFQLLQELATVAPEAVPSCALINASSVSERVRQFAESMQHLHLRFPIVLKPDIAQRGQGFKKISSLKHAAQYLSRVTAPVVLQEYVSDEYEIGIFYYRYPYENRGRILAITLKEFPAVVGNGHSTLRDLIHADERASLIADTYLNRFAEAAERVIPAGVQIRLVEAGNHCQGCIFKDGASLLTPKLEDAIDAIASKVPGFYIGRFDLRFADHAALAAGRGFKIIELNGAASEATNIYDAHTSLWSAYKTLFQQWRLVYAIGAANRLQGHRPATALSVLKDWFAFREMARAYPQAD
jgi:membrane protein DedA with SNARE-associated domain